MKNEEMRIYRWMILTMLAGATVVFLATAVVAYQTPMTPEPGQAYPSQLPEHTRSINLIVEENGLSILTTAQLLAQAQSFAQDVGAELLSVYNVRLGGVNTPAASSSQLYFYNDTTPRNPAPLRLNQNGTTVAATTAVTCPATAATAATRINIPRPALFTDWPGAACACPPTNASRLITAVP